LAVVHRGRLTFLCRNTPYRIRRASPFAQVYREATCVIIKQSTGLSTNAQGTQVECETHADRTLDDVSLYPGWLAAEAACDLSISCEVFAIMPRRFLLHSPTHVHWDPASTRHHACPSRSFSGTL